MRREVHNIETIYITSMIAMVLIFLVLKIGKISTDSALRSTCAVAELFV